MFIFVTVVVVVGTKYPTALKGGGGLEYKNTFFSNRWIFEGRVKKTIFNHSNGFGMLNRRSRGQFLKSKKYMIFYLVNYAGFQIFMNDFFVQCYWNGVFKTEIDNFFLVSRAFCFMYKIESHHSICLKLLKAVYAGWSKCCWYAMSQENQLFYQF